MKLQYNKNRYGHFEKTEETKEEVESVKEEIKEDVTHILFDATGHTPIVIPVINKV